MTQFTLNQFISPCNLLWLVSCGTGDQAQLLPGLEKAPHVDVWIEQKQAFDRGAKARGD